MNHKGKESKDGVGLPNDDDMLECVEGMIEHSGLKLKMLMRCRSKALSSGKFDIKP